VRALRQPVRVLTALVGLVVVLGIVVVIVARLGPGGSVQANRAVAAAEQFLDRYVEDDGRVARHDQGGDTVSEGQGYAMLLAVATHDEDRFDRIWGWTREHLQRDDGLLAWSWSGGRVVDWETASDADVEIAWALVLAAERFARPDLRADGEVLATALLDAVGVEAGGRLVLAAGPWATGEPIVANVSYFVPTAFEAIARVTGDGRWRRVWESSRALIAEVTGDARRLPPDWAHVHPDGSIEAVDDPGGSGAGRYGLDASRVPVRMASSCAAEDRALAAGLWRKLQHVEANGAHVAYRLDGGSLSEATNPLGVVAAAAAATAAGEHRRAEELLDDAAERAAAFPTYYGDAWVALGRVLLTSPLLGHC
jgi:endoglucanase